MKNTRRLIIFLLLVLLIASVFSGCASMEKLARDSAKKYINNMGFEVVEELGDYGDYRVFLVYDPTTMVEYLFTHGNGSHGFCPYYDEDGNVAFYDGE